MKFLALLPFFVVSLAAQPDLFKMAPGAAGFAEALTAAVPKGSLEKGEAWVGRGPDFLFAVKSEAAPLLLIDDAAPVKMTRAGGLWVHKTTLKPGTVHRFLYQVNGKPFGGKTDVPAFTPDHYEQPGVPAGKLSAKMVHTSKVYDGMLSDYWVYTPAAYDAARPAAVMVWQDGAAYTAREGSTRLQIVIDNLTHQKKIPAAVHIFIQPGLVGEKRMRSIEYDTVNDTYGLFLMREILPAVAAAGYNLRTDAYSRAIAGNSSGGICAFNAAWFMPHEFGRVLSRIGSFTSIQWKPGELDGGNVYPFKIRKEPKRNIRVWLQDGSEDLENTHGSWPYQNLQMANSLKMREYDFKLSFGTGTHNAAHGNAEAPAALTWLWRDYDAAKSAQTFEMDPAEKTKPFYRVKTLNRE
ncbi:MAG: esterase [Bryobacteraceae bacterium]|nr:esterase [Bryobacteraceae bacterium]